jgi:transposase
VAADVQFDGVFVLRTNMKLSALAVVLRYRNLLAVEQSLLAAKTLLATRPVFHRTDAAIRGHIGCTFLALLLCKCRRTSRTAVVPSFAALYPGQASIRSAARSYSHRRPSFRRCRQSRQPKIQPRCGA